MARHISATASALQAGFSVPWNAFVGAFLYYVLVTLVVVGGANIAAVLLGAAYLLPVALYAALLLNRALHALATLPVEIGETPHALQH